MPPTSFGLRRTKEGLSQVPKSEDTSSKKSYSLTANYWELAGTQRPEPWAFFCQHRPLDTHAKLYMLKIVFSTVWK